MIKRGVTGLDSNWMGDKNGQVTIFIILAVLIVVLGVVLFTFFPDLITTFGFQEENPNVFLQNCLEDKVLETLSVLSLQGGSLEPEHSIMFDNSDVEYLCYQAEDYLPCIVQQPLLIEHVESEIESNIENDVSECLTQLEDSFIDAGYEVFLNPGVFSVELFPQRVITNINSSLSLRKEETINYDSFSASFNNNLYELLTIANNILEFESTYGEAETTNYMDYYRDIKVEKNKKSDGTNIYVITERDSGNKFQFASRSVGWPAGYSE